MKGLGDAVAKVAQPIARGIDAIAGTNLQNCPTCPGRQQRLNRLSDEILDWFAARLGGRRASTSSEGRMQFTITRTILIEADDADKALADAIAGKGQTLTLSVNPRGVTPATAAQQQAVAARTAVARPVAAGA